jgi:hypothetical protein
MFRWRLAAGEVCSKLQLAVLTDTTDRNTNVVRREMFVSSLGTFGGWPSGADGALIFGDVVVVHAPALRLPHRSDHNRASEDQLDYVALDAIYLLHRDQLVKVVEINANGGTCSASRSESMRNSQQRSPG